MKYLYTITKYYNILIPIINTLIIIILYRAIVNTLFTIIYYKRAIYYLLLVLLYLY